MPPPTPLSRRPQATAFSIEDLLDRVRRGEVRVPEFQRRLRWKANDVRDLLDSVYRGYPIGTLLFWKREAPATVLHFGPVKIDAPQTAQALWAVDGQQRITALTGVLLHPPLEGDAAHDDFALYFDLEQEEFVRLARRATPPPYWLPMNRVLDSEQLLDWLDRYPGRADNPHHTRAAMKLGKAIREYQAPAYIVETDDQEVLRVIFGRLNSAGKPLTRAEVFNALHGTRNEEQPSDLQALSENLRELGFGTIEEEWLLKSVLAVRGLDINKDFKQQFQGEGSMPETLRQTEQALRAAIVFLKRDAGIPHVLLLPHKLLLVPLARFFHLHPQPSPRSRELLSRWFWRVIANLFFKTLRLTSIRNDLQSIGPDEEKTLQELLTFLHPPGMYRADLHIRLDTFKLTTFRTKVEANALLSFQPRDLRSGQLLDVPALLEREGAAALPHILPSARILSKTSSPDWSITFYSQDTLANRLIHPPVADPPLYSLLRSALSMAPEVLQSHAVPPGAIDALHHKDFTSFVELRGDLLTDHIRRFLDSRARWEAADHGSLRSMIVSDEED
ncbi:DUF262 domain-containing protein [Archangium violaceum]|uniref:DUF262 domain-containing protein n=1 Tax=Archangium violaceum TaxID=83451 RepID=UPI0019516076|nr:DUF262 domain-containing protein [Archangium violaceum]QRN97301.1 DUF262 domain-containing protein [Archangium violaceum]